MRPYFIGLVLGLLTTCSQSPGKELQLPTAAWTQRKIDLALADSMVVGKSYLSVYSQIYSFTQHKKYNLTGMISLRNMSENDTIYLLRADYFNTGGQLERAYLSGPIYLTPLETLEIVIDQEDEAGGTGSNFIFEWQTPPACPAPLFEGVMNSMQGTQGISFTTQAHRIE